MPDIDSVGPSDCIKGDSPAFAHAKVGDSLPSGRLSSFLSALWERISVRRHIAGICTNRQKRRRSHYCYQRTTKRGKREERRGGEGIIDECGMTNWLCFVTAKSEHAAGFASAGNVKSRLAKMHWQI